MFLYFYFSILALVKKGEFLKLFPSESLNFCICISPSPELIEYNHKNNYSPKN
jgi:hypothetical protein